MDVRAIIALLVGLTIMGGGALYQRKTGELGGAGDAYAVARVNGTVVSAEQLDKALERVLGSAADSADDATRRKVLESLVLNRVLAQEAEKLLSEGQRSELDLEMQHQREQWLTRTYLLEHASPEPLSEARIREYYEKNATAFGGGVERRYEMIATTADPGEEQRQQIVDAFGQLTAALDWEAQARKLADRKLPIQYRRGGSSEAALPSRIKSAIAGAAVGGNGELVLAGGRPYLVRVSEKVQRAARPLEEVRSDIARALIATQLKSALEGISKELLQSAEIEYLGN